MALGACSFRFAPRVSRVSTRFGLKVSGWEISGADRSQRLAEIKLMGGREMIKETLCVVKGKGGLMGKRGEVMHVPRIRVNGWKCSTLSSFYDLNDAAQ